MRSAERGGAVGASKRGNGRLFAALAFAFATVTLSLTGVFAAAEWYGERVAMTRYCDDPAGAAALARRVISEPRPAADASTRPYIVAAKLIYLVPKHEGETAAAYETRLRRAINRRCQ